MSLFKKWLIYPILALLVELPNMLVIYMIHWWTYKPIIPPNESQLVNKEPEEVEHTKSVSSSNSDDDSSELLTYRPGVGFI